MEGVIVCSLCGTRSPSISLLLSHLRLVHVSDTNISLSCPVSECNATYSKVNSLCSHVYRKHKETPSALAPTTVRNSSVISASSQEDMISSTLMLDISLPEYVQYDIDQLLHRDAREQMKKSMLFLMQLKEERLVTQAAINDVVVGCKEVFTHTLCRIKAAISGKLSQSEIGSSCDEICSIFDDMSDPFTGLESVYLQDKFITEELGCIVSVTLI